MMQPLLDRNVIVTGATSGIGLATARELARFGAHVTIISRNIERCQAVVEQIKAETGNPNVEFIVADLSVMADVRQAAYEFKKSHTQLHVLVNNAGAFFNKRVESADGIEMTFALNHLSYFLLTQLLLDILKASAPARVVNVSSDAHRGVKLDFDDLQCAKKFNGFGAYSKSKMANILFTYELAHRLQGSGITANALHPGVVATGFASKNSKGIIAFSAKIVDLFSRSPREGAETSIYLASSNEVDKVSGKYYKDCKMTDSDPATYNRATQEKLWNASLELILDQ